MLRRKPAFAVVPAPSKQPPQRRTAGQMSVAGVVVSVLLVAAFLYNEDVGGGGKHHKAVELSSPDLRVLQELDAAHHKVNSHRSSPTTTTTPTSSSSSSSTPPLDEPVRILDAPIISSSSSSSSRRADKQATGYSNSSSSSSMVQAEAEAAKKVAVALQPPEKESSECDLYKGWWVYDALGEQAPLYRESECEFLTEQVTCMRNGRRDDSYQRWRWQPAGCDMPRFDAAAFLERLRNKRLMFVGDSLNRNQWESMVCLLQSAVPAGHKTLTKFVNNGSLNIFKAHSYNATVEFYWAPFLVQSNSDDPQVHSVADRVIAWRNIARHARNWKGVHYLVFNTYIWWLNTFDIKVLKARRQDVDGAGAWSSGNNHRRPYSLVDRPVAYREVLKTWAKWVDRRVDPAKTMVFFMAMSPNHIVPEAWGGEAGAVKCAMETQPMANRTGPLDIGTDWRLHGVARGVLRSMRRVPVRFVDITALSELRKDAHTSVHTLRQGKLLTPEQQADPRAYADCIHWCLPGLPDTWNHFLYAHIVASSPSSS